MKNHPRPLHCIVASVAALVVLTANAVVTAAALTAGGIVALLVIDYGRANHPPYREAQVVPFAGRRPEAAARDAA
jgi:hypothetical protein